MLISLLVFSASVLMAQENLTYQKPSNEILELVDVNLAPTVRMNHERTTMVLLSRDPYKTIAELSKEELRLGGLRIDPATNIGSRTRYYKNIHVKSTGNDAPATQVSGLPDQPLLASFTWSPDQKHMAFTQTASEGVELWMLDIENASARKLTAPTVNANIGQVINWFEDSQSMLVKMVPARRKALIDVKQAVPTGPTISVADGKKAQNRTYQDLLKNKNDEFNFEQLATSEIVKVKLDGTSTPWMESAMYQ